MGQGEIEHQRLQNGRLIEDEIRFTKPFRSVSQVSFELQPAVNGTRITWNMRGKLPWFLFWMAPQMKAFIGMDYERGLKMLKEWIETGQIRSQTSILGIRSVGPLKMAGIRKASSLRDMQAAMKMGYQETKQRLSAADLPNEGEAISVYRRFDWKSQRCEFISGCLLPNSTDKLPSGLSLWSIPTINAFCVRHSGSDEHLRNAWNAARQNVRYRRLKQSRASAFEIHRHDPQKVPKAERQTDVFLPLR